MGTKLHGSLTCARMVSGGVSDCRPSVNEKTNAFCIPKKDIRLRNILACVNFKSCCEEPPRCRLPGTWNIQKIRFRRKKVLLGRKRCRERCECFLLAFTSAGVDEVFLLPWQCANRRFVFEVQAGETYTCPYTGHTFGADDKGRWGVPALAAAAHWSRRIRPGFLPTTAGHAPTPTLVFVFVVFVAFVVLPVIYTLSPSYSLQSSSSFSSCSSSSRLL